MNKRDEFADLLMDAGLGSSALFSKYLQTNNKEVDSNEERKS